MNDETIGMLCRNGLPELLQGPFRRRMRSDVVMQDSPPAYLQYDKYIEDTETGRDHDEKVTRHEGLRMVADERQPALGRIGRTTCRRIPKVLSNGAW